MPNPVCQDSNFIFENTTRIQRAEDYNGNASNYDWVLEGGNITIVEESLAMILTESNGGTRLASTRYMHYAKMTARVKTGRWPGVVTAFITMSDIHDEIDWEWPGNNTKQAQSNWFWQGDIPTPSNGETHAVSSDTYSNWHNYTIDWTPTTLTFLIDETVVRTVSSNNSNQYPNTPSRIELSLWPAGIITEAPGTVQWAGGMIDWNDPDYIAAGGQFQAFIESVTVICADTSSPPSGTTSYIYGSNSTTDTPSINFSSLTTVIETNETVSNGSSNGSSIGSGSGYSNGSAQYGSSGGTSGSPSSLNGSSSASGSSGGSGMSAEKIGIIAGSIIGGLAALVIGALIIRFAVRLFHKGGSPSVKGSEAQGFSGKDSQYRPLLDPAPSAAVETHALPSLHYDGGRYD